MMANASFDYNVAGNEEPSPNAKAVAEKLNYLQANISKCAVCDKRVYDNEKFVLDQRIYHKVCFRCSTCRSTLTVKTFRLGGGMLYCHRHYLESFHKFNSYDFKESPARRPSIESHGKSSTTSSSNERNLVREPTIQKQLSRESYDRPVVQAGERPPMVELPTSPSASGPNTGAGVNNIRAMFETGVKSTSPPSAYGQEKRNDAAVLSMMMNQSTTKARMAKFSGNSVDETPHANNEQSHSSAVIQTTTHSSDKQLSFDDNDNDTGRHEDNIEQYHHQQLQQHYVHDREEEEEDEEEREHEVPHEDVAERRENPHEEGSDYEDNHDVDDSEVEVHAQQNQYYSNQHGQVRYDDDDEEQEDGYHEEENGENHDEDNDQE